MENYITNVFKLISQSKNISPSKLLISNEDEKLFFKSYIKFKMFKRTTYKKWRNCIINYTIEKGSSFNDSIKYFVDYAKNNKT